VLAGDVTTQVPTTGKLPDIFTYSAGADLLVLENRLSLTGDFIGQSLLDASRIAEVTVTDFGGNTHQTIVTSTGTVTQANIAIGGKYRPAGRFLIIGNILFELSNHGLHSKPVPLIGVTYTF
jgi:Ca2+-binding RTX toxin-like protein